MLELASFQRVMSGLGQEGRVSFHVHSVAFWTVEVVLVQDAGLSTAGCGVQEILTGCTIV